MVRRHVGKRLYAAAGVTSKTMSSAYVAVTIVSGLVPVILYGALYLSGVDAAWWGRLPQSAASKLVIIFMWMLSAASYIYLWQLTLDDPGVWGGGLFVTFPLVAAVWAFEALYHSEPTATATAAVLINAVLSLFFVVMVGQHSDELKELQVAAATVLVVQHAFIDGVAWPPRQNLKSATRSFGLSAHGVAAVIHIASAVGLYIAGAWVADHDHGFYNMPIAAGSWTWDSLVWRFNCTSNATGADCDEKDRQYRLGNRGDHPSVALLDLAALFAVWSGAHHLVANSAEILQIDQWIFRIGKWIDYAVSAPLMLLVISSTYGSYGAPALVYSPLLLFLLLVASGLTEWWQPRDIATIFWPSVLAYGFVWASAIITFDKVTQDNKGDDAGAAPKFVWAFLAITIAIFSAFVVVRAVEVTSEQMGQYERAYLLLSAIAKTTLHLFVGLTVVQTGSVLDESNMTESNTLAPGLGGAAAIVLVMSAWAMQVEHDSVVPTAFGPVTFEKLIG